MVRCPKRHLFYKNSFFNTGNNIVVVVPSEDYIESSSKWGKSSACLRIPLEWTGREQFIPEILKITSGKNAGKTALKSRKIFEIFRNLCHGTRVADPGRRLNGSGHWENPDLSPEKSRIRIPNEKKITLTFLQFTRIEIVQKNWDINTYLRFTNEY